MNTLHRIQEWLAERLPSVQYPRQQFIPADSQPTRLTWKYPMPMHYRIALALVSLLALAVLVPVLIAMLVVGWAFVRAIFLD